MSKYTVEIAELVNAFTSEQSEKPIYERIDLALPIIFNFTYPIWNEEYRRTLERKIVMHYFKKEIGFETIGLWQLYLSERLNLIMPYYNKMYETTVIDYEITNDHNNLVSDSDTTTATNTRTGTTENTNTNNVTDTVTGEQIDCNTPQARINGGDYASFITNNNNTNTQVATGNNVNTVSDTIENTNYKTHTHTETGNNIPIADLVMKYRDTLINIDNLVIEELHDLFMMIY